MTAIKRHNVRTHGADGKAMIFAHGFGCDQNMWRFVEPAFRQDYRTILFDYVGLGGSDVSAYDLNKYSTLDGYADDVIAIGHELGIKGGVFVGHSVSSMIGVLASLKAPDMFEALVLVGPSARYIDDEDYRGGFTAVQIAELLDFLKQNHMAWSAAYAPAIMGNPDKPELEQELTDSFCRADPAIAHQFATVTFMSDNRSDLSSVKARTLILQSKEDVIASPEVGMFVQRNIPGSELIMLDATGHCPNLSAPDEVVAAMKAFV